MIDRKCWVYDIETLINCFTYSALNIDTQEKVFYVIHKERDERNDLYQHLTSIKFQIGFNNLAFDYLVLHYILLNWNKLKDVSADVLANMIYVEAQRVIESSTVIYGDKFTFNGIPEWKHKIAQLDLFKLNHFDNKAKLCGLKQLQMWMNYPNVQDMPIHHSTMVTSDMFEDIQLYNDNDVDSTYEFYKKCIPLIDLRKSLSTLYGINLRNASEPKIGSEIFLSLLSKDMGIEKKELKTYRTKRDIIYFKDILLPYISFNSTIFKSFHTALKTKYITETKDAFKYSVIYKGFKYDFGLGGIHGCIKPGIYESTSDYIIHDIDVQSFYPNLAIVNNFKPEHLGEAFNKIYKSIFDERKITPKKDPKNAAYKLMLNGVYGKSNESTSYLYDPQFTMSITVNGQLLLVMLSEQFADLGCEILQINTDGVTIKYHKSNKDKIESICNKWCKITMLQLEHAYYDKMIIMDVNNYCALKDDKSIKYKGLFEINKEPYKDNSFKIIPIALSEYFINNIPIEDTVKNHINIYDFCGRQKFKSDSYGEIHYLTIDNQLYKEKQQKTTRYYIINKGGTFVKVYPEKNKWEFINKGYQVEQFNKYIKKDDYNINYDFYIKETQKIINQIEPSQLILF